MFSIRKKLSEDLTFLDPSEDLMLLVRSSTVLKSLVGFLWKNNKETPVAFRLQIMGISELLGKSSHMHC